jgi:hypothetical protein
VRRTRERNRNLWCANNPAAMMVARFWPISLAQERALRRPSPLDAQVSFTRARFNAVAALADYNSALATWLRATGRVR